MAEVKRKIELDLVEFMLGKLQSNAGFQAAIRAKDKRSAFRSIMVYGGQALVGIRELTGKNDGKRVEQIQETVGGHSQEAYCAGGVQTCIAFAEKLTGLKSPIIVSELATGIWFDTIKNHPELRIKNVPAPGALAVWQDVSAAGKKKITGHIELVEAAFNTGWNGIGFNTSGASYPGGPVTREGNGVYYTKRNYDDKAKRIFLGHLKPI